MLRSTCLTGALVASALLATACGGGKASVSAAPTYNDAAVQHVLAEMVTDGQFLSPTGGPVSATDQTALLQVVQEACKGPNKIQTMVRTLSANPYLLSVALTLAQTGCPKVMADAGVQAG